MSDILKTDEPVWLFYDGLPVPFYIQTLQFKGQRKAILRLEDVDSYNDAEEAVGKELYIDPAGYPELSATDAHQINEDGLTLEDLTGFTLLNICLEIEGSGSLIPYHDDLLLDIDPDSRTVTLRISDGLL